MKRVQEQIAVRDFLSSKYERLRVQTPGYSKRDFSRQVGISPGSLTEILNCERRISPKLAKRIATKLGLDPQERAEFLDSLSTARTWENQFPTKLSKKTYTQLSVDQFRLIGDWYHFAILTLMTCKDFKSDRSWISNRLGITKATLNAAIERLKRIGAIKESTKGWLTCSEPQYRTSDDIASASIKKAHQQYLEKARNALDNLPPEERDFTSLMLSFSPEQMVRAKERIRQFQDDFCAEFEATPQPEVYQLCVQLFPLTKRNPS